MSSTQSSKQLALKGKKAAFDMVRAMNKLEVATKDIIFKLFDLKFSFPYCMHRKSGAYWSQTIMSKKFTHIHANDFWMFRFERLTTLYTVNWEDFLL